VQAGHGPGRDRAGKAPGGEENTQVRRIVVTIGHLPLWSITRSM
jgi:hypothetical protein